MKIIPKLTVALVAGTCVILAGRGWMRVVRERRFFEADRVRDHERVGRSLAAAAEAVWRSDGEDAAIEAIDAVSRHSTNLRIRWVPFPPSSPDARLALDVHALETMPAGEPVTIAPVSGVDGEGLWKTYVPLDAGGVRRGVIVLSESPLAEERFLRSTVLDTATTAGGLAVLSALLSLVLGEWLVGRPVRMLAEKARRTGRGDFSSPLSMPQRDELGELAGEVNAMCDRLVTTLDQLRHADRLATVGKLASGVAHELGTPLNVVGARARMIQAGEATAEESREYAGIIVGATGRMTATIRQLLQFARRDGPERAPRDVEKLASDALDLLRPLARQARVELKLAPAVTDATTSVDGGQIQQAITNLIMNAVQAMPEGGAVEVRVGRERVEPPAEVRGPEAEYLCLRVVDEGEGISPENLPRIFEPFFTTKDVGRGTGLGLAVTYGIIRDHGGFITVESKVGQGTCFAVYLPLPETNEHAHPSGR